MTNDAVLGTTVIYTALDVEYNAVRDHLDAPITEREERGILYEIGTFRTDHGRWRIALRQTGVGNATAAAELEHGVSAFHPQIVLFVGVAGGRKDVRLGDVVIADHIYDYESGRDTADGLVPGIKTRAPAHRLLERARPLARDDSWQHRIRPTSPATTPKAVVKPIAAGSKVIADQNAATAQYLAKHCGDAVAVEMEGSGFLHGAYLNDAVQALVVRGISDLLSGKTGDADRHWQPVASAHAAAFAFELLARYSPPRADAVAPRQLIAAPAGFVGRVDQLAALDRVLTTPEGSPPADVGQVGGATAVISTIGGTGGIGKTWLALTWAHRNLDHFPDGQLSVDLRGFSPDEPRPAIDVLADFLSALGVDRDHQPADLDARIALYRTHTTGKRLLILLDNAASVDQVEHLLPGGRCTVLVTSRDRLRGLIARHGARPVYVDVLTEAEARTLLTAALGDIHATAVTEGAVAELVSLCQGFPLALGLIAAQVRTHPDLLDEIVADLRDLGLDALDSDDHMASLPTVLSWSLRRLTTQQRTAFVLLAVAPGPDIDLHAATSLIGLSERDTRAALRGLVDSSLIAHGPGGRFTMHDLIRDYACTADEHVAEPARLAALDRVVDFYRYTADTAGHLLGPEHEWIRLEPPGPAVRPHLLEDVRAALDWLDAHHPHLLAAQRIAAIHHRHQAVCHLASTVSAFDFRRGNHRDQLSMWQVAAAAAIHLPDSATLIGAHHHLGGAYAGLRMHERAIEHLHQALDLAEHHHDPIHQVYVHHSIAWAWARQKDYGRALEHARRGLDLVRPLDESVWEARMLNTVGWCAAQLNEYDTAWAHCQAALALQRQHHDSDEADTLDSLGYIAHHTGQHAHALDYYRQALALYRERGNIYDEAGTLVRLGQNWAALGDQEHARVVWRQALELYQEQGSSGDARSVQRQLDDLDNPGGAADPRN